MNRKINLKLQLNLNTYRSGEEGKYQELENFVCDKLEKLAPNRYVQNMILQI